MAKKLFSPHRPLKACVITEEAKDALVKKARSAGADLLELRIDTFKDKDPASLKASAKRARAIARLPLLLTVRAPKEGGASRLSDASRLELYRELVPFADAVDIELRSSKILRNVIKFSKQAGKKVIVSFHDFKATPSRRRLAEIIKKARSAGADAVKIAARAQKSGDVKRLAALLMDSDDLIVIAMGARGAASRIFFPMLGSLVTYGSLDGKAAPGQLPLKKLAEEMKRYGI